jgi:hypothetical protein
MKIITTTKVVIGKTKFKVNEFTSNLEPTKRVRVFSNSPNSCLGPKIEYFGNTIEAYVKSYGEEKIVVNYTFPRLADFHCYSRTSIYRIEGSDDGKNIKVGEAVCLNLDKIEIDVKCCRFPKYYKGISLPTDTQELEITYFLVFASGSEFEILWTTEDINADTHVFGGMSSVGYGYFN